MTKSNEKKIQWSQLDIDWSLSNAQIAAQVGCSEHKVIWARKSYSVSDNQKKKLKNINLSLVNWNQSLKKIAKMLNIPYHQAQALRKKHAPELIRKSRPKIPWDEFDIDWSLPVKKIAAQVGCSEGAVRDKIKRMNQGAGSSHRKQRINPQSIDWSMTTTQIADKYEISYARAYQLRKEHAPETFIKKLSPVFVDWESIDWTKSNKQISEEAGCAVITVWQNRNLHAPETVVRQSPRIYYDWENADYTKTNKQLAEEIGCTPRTAQKNRKKYASKK